MPSRDLADLREPLRDLAHKWLEDCAGVGLEVLIYCTLRSLEEQAKLYAQGRGGRPGPILTYAKPGESAHNYGLAFDYVPLLGGKPQWRAAGELYIRGRDLAEALGLESASRWSRFIEWPHIQLPNWRAVLAAEGAA